MAMDLSRMDEMRLSYFHKKMSEFVERQAKRHTAALLAEEAAKVVEEAGTIVEADNAASAAVSEIARNLQEAIESVQVVVPIVVQVALASLEEAAAVEETESGALVAC